MRSGFIEQQARKKSPDNERLFNSLCYLLPNGDNHLFADAEAGEDGVEDFLGGDGACYCGEVVYGFAQVVG